MKFFVYVTFFSLIGSFFPLSTTYAQDDIVEDSSSKETAQEEVLKESDVLANAPEKPEALLESLPTSGDAVKGIVSQNTSTDYYDIHGRTLAFRENIKELRASIDTRRVAFEEPRVKVLERYRDTKEKIYEEEMAADNESQEDEVIEQSHYDDSSYEQEIAEEQEEPDIGLTEKNIPSNDDASKKKVVTSEDAPDFDPSNL